MARAQVRRDTLQLQSVPAVEGKSDRRAPRRCRMLRRCQKVGDRSGIGGGIQVQNLDTNPAREPGMRLDGRRDAGCPERYGVLVLVCAQGYQGDGDGRGRCFHAGTIAWRAFRADAPSRGIDPPDGRC